MPLIMRGRGGRQPPIPKERGRNQRHAVGAEAVQQIDQKLGEEMVGNMLRLSVCCIYVLVHAACVGMVETTQFTVGFSKSVKIQDDTSATPIGIRANKASKAIQAGYTANKASRVQQAKQRKQSRASSALHNQCSIVPGV